jgi:hypothetical protein
VSQVRTPHRCPRRDRRREAAGTASPCNLEDGVRARSAPSPACARGFSPSSTPGATRGRRSGHDPGGHSRDADRRHGAQSPEGSHIAASPKARSDAALVTSEGDAGGRSGSSSSRDAGGFARRSLSPGSSTARCTRGRAPGTGPTPGATSAASRNHGGNPHVATARTLAARSARSGQTADPRSRAHTRHRRP